jgi:hypothetical protein
VAYESRDAPFDVADLSTFLSEELASIAASFKDMVAFERNVEPDKPFQGQIVLADGTNWDPGSGQGFYGYDGATWRFLG